MRWRACFPFLPLACSTPWFLVFISVLLARICNIYILSWNCNSPSSLILITYWNEFRSPTLHVPFLLSSWDLSLILLFLFNKFSFFKRGSVTPAFREVLHIWECLPITLDLSSPQNVNPCCPVFIHSRWEKCLYLPHFPQKVSNFFFVDAWDFFLYH